MSLTRIAVRALFAYLFLLALLRASGKRTVAQGTPLDFVVALILGDMVDNLLWAEVPASVFVAGTGAVALSHVLLTIGRFQSRAFKRLVDGHPTPLVKNGEPDPRGLRKERVSEAGLMALLRHRSIRDARELQELQLEPSGAPGILKRFWARPAQKRDIDRVRKAVQ